VITRPTVSHLCHIDEPPLYPGCDCPPAPCTSGATPNIVFAYSGSPPLGNDGDPFIIPRFTAHSDTAGHLEPRLTRDSSLSFTIEVDTNGVAIPSVQIHLALDAADHRGTAIDSIFGHFHHDSSLQKPSGQLSDTAPVTSSTSPYRATVVYTPSQYSEPVFLTVTSPGVATVAKHWSVGVPSLAHMTGSYITLVGEITPHPNSHFVVPSMMPTLDSLGAYWVGLYHTNLLINDMSLAYGGKFDLDLHWEADSVHRCKPHCEHRLGRSADINGLSSLDTVPYHNVVFWWNQADTGLYYFNETGKAHLRDWRWP
jgi:hypothetical protein